jgi:hypothetical protein
MKKLAVSNYRRAKTTAAPLRKSWVVLTYRRTKTILLQRCENRGRL